MDKLKKIKKLFNTNKDGTTHCFSLVCWTDGMWSVNVTDDWHKWLGKDVPKLEYKYYTPEEAIRQFFNHIKTHKINLKELQSDD